MFTRQKTQTDVKKSTLKFLDLKKDVPTRLKHLKLILDSVDIVEAKSLFATNYSHIYHLVYEGIVCAESSLKLKGGFLSPSLSLSFESLHFSSAHRELTNVLLVLERVIVLLPDLLHCRWQLHSISRLMAKLNHAGNALVLRKEAIRLFLLWYQCLGTAAPAYVHSMFASLVPGLPGAENWPPAGDPSMSVSPYEVTPILPATSGEKNPEDITSFFMELLLDFMVSQAPKIHWNDGSHMWSRSIEFLYERFRIGYLPRIFHDFSVTTDIYKPSLDLPEPRKSVDMSNNVVTACQVVFVRWIANYAHSVHRSTDYSIAGQLTAQLQYHSHSFPDYTRTSTPPSSLGDKDSITSFTSINNDVDANIIAKDVILGSRENINFLHEVFRRALLMNFVQTIAIRRVICVYKDWIQINVPELPVFMLEPEEVTNMDNPNGSHTPKSSLIRDSYSVGINANNNREEYLSHLRAGAQKVLQVFFCNSAAVFLLFQIPKHEAAMAFLEEQVDICKRVLNIYRYAVMNTRMSPETWEQLLVVLLHITSKVLTTKESHFGIKNPDSLGFKLASALFQTLIVSWVKASLNVPLSVELWDRLHDVLSSLTVCDDLVVEWSKTMETLTRVLARHVYGLDLANLPLDRLSEQKTKRKRQGVQSLEAPSQRPLVTVEKEPVARAVAIDGRLPRERLPSTSDRKSLVYTPSTPIPKNKLKRSLSDGNLLTPKKVENETSTDGELHSHSLVTSGYKHHKDDFTDGIILMQPIRQRKKSHSMDSLKTLKIAKHFGHIGQPGQLNPDWADISSSTTSLDNTSTIHIDDTNSIDCHNTGLSKTEVGVISGGLTKGWLPSVACILWRRMLGILGNVNEFSSPTTHAHFFQVLIDIWKTLFKVRMNMFVSLDNLSTPKPSELCPPLTCFAEWCFQALDLSDDFYRGKVLACSLLCDMTSATQDIPLSQEYLTKFYAVIHRTIIANQPDMVNEIVRRCGYKFVSKMLPGFSLLLLDLSQASHSVLKSDDLKKAPRLEAATILGAVLTVADVCRELPILKPGCNHFQPVTSHSTHNVVLTCLLDFSKREQTSHARVICLQSIGIYLSKELMKIRLTGFRHNSEEKERIGKIKAIVLVILASVQVANRSVALVAAELLLLLSDFSNEIDSHFPTLIPKIILGLKWSLQQTLPLKNTSWTIGKPVETEKRLLISLLTTLGEWCMKLPISSLLTPIAEDRSVLLSSVFEVLHMAANGFQLPGTNDGSFQIMQDFNSSVPFDDLQIAESNLKASEKEKAFRNSSSQDLQTVISHLLTQMGHYPMGNGSMRCGSIISENDDITGIQSELDELSTYIFSLPNVQMLALDQETLLSIVELPPQENGDGTYVSSEFESSASQVRLILRNLSGKSCWDASLLSLATASNEAREKALGSYTRSQSEDMFYLSTLTGTFLPQIGPRLTVRRRIAGLLPTVSNSAEDLDNLDDNPGESINTPCRPPYSISQEREDDVVGQIVNQRNSELEYLMKFDMDITMKGLPVSNGLEADCDGDAVSEKGEPSSLTTSNKSIPNVAASFALSRRLFSQLGLTGWDKRQQVDILNRDEKLLRQIKFLDSQNCRETHKIAVIFVARGQEDKHSILNNTGGSELYEDFVAGLGWEVDLMVGFGFAQRWPFQDEKRNKSTGETAPYFATSFTEIIFHVATRMPSCTEESLLQKTRHLGNDEVFIVWSEHDRDYRRDIIPTEFCDVLIVIYPLKFGLFRVQISRKSEVPYFGPLYNEAVVESEVLPILVRSTAINASRAKRSSLPGYQYYFEERSKSLATIINNHKSRTTSFSSTSRGSSTTVTPSTSSTTQLSAALLDSTVPPSYRRSTYDVPFTPPEIRSGRLSGIGGDSSIPETSTPPIPPKKLALKLGSGIKQKLHTPPASPVPPVKSTGSHYSNSSRP